jgi:iron complex transport system ATP-binding protein
VAGGEVVALAGPNGSGKTTLLKLAAGLLRSSSGSVELDGKPVSGWGRVARAKRLAYVPQSPVLPDDWPVRDLVALGDFPHQEDPPAPRPLARRLEEARNAMELEGVWSRPAGTLSGGEAQRVALARALVQDARVLVLDEPANHLDLKHQMGLFALLAGLARAGRAVLLSTHDLNLSRLCGQRMVVLDGSGVLKELPADRSAQGRLLGDVFGVEFVPQEHAGVVCWLPEVGREGAGELGSWGAGEGSDTRERTLGTDDGKGRG